MTQTERDRIIIVEQKIDAINDKLDIFIKCKDDHEMRIRTLESKPSKRWDIAIIAVITSVVGGVIGSFISILSK